MQKHFLKIKKVFTNIACSPLLLLANNSELAAKFLPNDVKHSISTLEIKNINNVSFEFKPETNVFIAENDSDNFDVSIPNPT